MYVQKSANRDAHIDAALFPGAAHILNTQGRAALERELEKRAARRQKSVSSTGRTKSLVKLDPAYGRAQVKATSQTRRKLLGKTELAALLERVTAVELQIADADYADADAIRDLIERIERLYQFHQTDAAQEQAIDAALDTLDRIESATKAYQQRAFRKVI